MVEAKRWCVTYTKHVTQKRKVYQDGHLQLSHNKIMLYDDCEKVIDSRFLKKDETLKSGDTLAFDSHLVDIGDAEGEADCKPVVKVESDSQFEENTIAGKHRLSLGKKLRNNSFSSDIKLGRGKVSSINVSSSKKVIRDFKKGELSKYRAQQSPPASTSPLMKEWLVLYTGQMTQKSKKYHDGFLKLVICGSSGRQVKLYDANKNLLDSRFLKKDEVIRSGDSLRLDAYLVDIGDVDRDCEKLQEVKVEKQSCEISQKNRTFKGAHPHHNSSSGKQLGDVHLVKNVILNSHVNQMSPRKEVSTRTPLRDANTILLNLKKPTARESLETMRGVPVKPYFLPPGDFVQVDSEVQDQLQVQLEYHNDNSAYSSEQHSSDKRAAATGSSVINICESTTSDAKVGNEDVLCDIKQEIEFKEVRPASSTGAFIRFNAADTPSLINDGKMDRPFSSTEGPQTLDVTVSNAPTESSHSVRSVQFTCQQASSRNRVSLDSTSSKGFEGYHLLKNTTSRHHYELGLKSIKREPTSCPLQTDFVDHMSRTDTEATASDDIGAIEAAETKGFVESKSSTELDEFPSFDLGF